MAEVRLRLGSVGSRWMTTPYYLLHLLTSKRRADVCAVTRAIHRSCILSHRSYRTSGAEEIPLYRSKSAYYDLLQVSPSATQAQIKTAYYKQSFICHPDKNKGNEDAVLRFSQISEAYSVLGNKTLRKKYDSGILSKADIRAPSRPSAPTMEPKDPSSRSPGGAPGPRPSELGSQNVFNFDSFYRAHYGEQLQRQKDIRARLQDIQRQNEGRFQGQKLKHMSGVAVGFMLVVAVAIIFSMRSTKG